MCAIIFLIYCINNYIINPDLQYCQIYNYIKKKNCVAHTRLSKIVCNNTRSIDVQMTSFFG